MSKSVNPTQRLVLALWATFGAVCLIGVLSFGGSGRAEVTQMQGAAVPNLAVVNDLEGCPSNFPVDCKNGYCCPSDTPLCCGAKQGCCPSGKPWACPAKRKCYATEEELQANCGEHTIAFCK